ncbi:glycoside hydrolase superfamily [Gongronella butleri]|nr:glycoside hydrolase superfamily [Gongronella butleri]
MKGLSLFMLASSMLTMAVQGFENDCNDNLAVYWGQNSYGAANAGDPANWQGPLRQYCTDNSIDIIPMAFVTNFFGTGGLPVINLANICNSKDNGTFAGTDLANCQALASDIQYCQSQGKAVTLSLGGATGGVGFSSDAQASGFADTLWNLFMGGSSNTRPFGAAVLDGVDLDIEGGGGSYYGSFITQLRSHFNGASKKYYITAAPQCVYPDANLGTTISQNSLDAIYVQFYNNPCGLQTYNTTGWNYGVWDYWARNKSPNKDIKVYIGAPASSSAAGGGYVPLSTLSNIAVSTRQNFPSFGGVMFWDASQAVANGHINQGIKAALSAGGSCGKAFDYPACSAPAYQSGQNYPGGSKVSANGYIWQAMWYASGPPDDSFQTWIPISACAGSGSGSTTTSSTTTTAATTTTVSTTTTKASTTTSSASSTPTSGTGSCGSVAAWSSTNVYTSGNQVSYNGYVWTAQWWTQGDTPGGAAGVWTKGAACSSASTKRSLFGRAAGACTAPTWQRTTQYPEGSKVLHKGKVYEATWFTVNEEPGAKKTLSWEVDTACHAPKEKRTRY